MENNNDTINNFRFLTCRCRDCDADFVITPSQQQWLLERSLSIPTHCPSCLLQRKIAKKLEENSPTSQMLKVTAAIDRIGNGGGNDNHS
jgi:hypothetical protein